MKQKINNVEGQMKYPVPLQVLSPTCMEELLKLFEADAGFDYLHNEDRILSIAREKQERFLQKYSLSNMEEYLYRDLDDEITMSGLLKILSNRFRKLLRDCGKENNLKPLEAILSCPYWNVRIFLLTDEEEAFPDKRSVLAGRHRRTYAVKGTYAFGVELENTGKDKALWRYAASDEPVDRDGIFRHYCVKFTDLGRLFARLFLLKSAYQQILEEGESKADEYAYGDGWYIFRDADNLRSMADLLPHVAKINGALPVYSAEEAAFYRKNGYQLRQVIDYNLRLIFLSNPHDYLVDGYNPFHVAVDDGGDVSVASFLTETILYIASRKAAEVEKAEEYRSMKGKAHAKAYQTKKNIPDKMLKQMKESAFNNYFGYVEFDEECDISKIELIGKEVFAFFAAMPKIKGYTKDNSIRFRKLGNHKAIGLYYPMIHCLCVDLRSVRSFIHELGHLIDHCMEKDGQMSEKAAFFDVLCDYRKYLDRSKKDLSKGKYNLKYYKEATEVFARSFELYVVKVKKYKNSLMPETFDTRVYPEGEGELMKKISDYFDSLNLFDEFEVTEEGTVVAKAEEEPEITSNGFSVEAVDKAIREGATIYLEDTTPPEEQLTPVPITDARKKALSNYKIMRNNERNLTLYADCNGQRNCILGSVPEKGKELVEYLNKHFFQIIRVEEKSVAASASAAETKPLDLKKLRGQELLNAIKAPKLTKKERDDAEWYEYEGKIEEWVSLLALAFNTFSTGSYTIPEEWIKNKSFWQKVAYIELCNLSKEADTWDERKKLAATVSARLLANEKLKAHAEKLGGNAPERRGIDFFYQLKCKFCQEHPTIRQSMATFFMRYLYDTDTVFKAAAEKEVPEYTERSFRFPMI